MLIFKDNNLHFLIKKYHRDKEIGKAINILLQADQSVLDGCNCIDDKTLLPDMKVLDEWQNKFKQIYKKAIGLLEKCSKKYPKNADILVLLGYGYFRIDDFKEAIKYYQKALDIEPKEDRFMKELIRVREHLAYEIFKKSPEGIEYTKWHKEWVVRKVFGKKGE